LFVLSLAVLALALVPAAGLAAKGGGGGGKPGGGGGGKPGGGGGGSCTQAAPRASVDNSYAWAAKGSFGLPGQQLKYAINVFNNDVGCGSATFVVSMSAPSGFAVSSPATITLNSASSGYVWATVTSPNPIADGDYPLNVTVTRSGTADAAGPFPSLYKVYSSDSVGPRLYYPNPWDGATVSGGSYAFAVASTDDHAVKKIDLYVDNVYRSTSVCDNIAYECQLYSVGSPGSAGQHTATFKSYDWLGNVTTLTTTFTVN
jgi:hypothetical protein